MHLWHSWNSTTIMIGTANSMAEVNSLKTVFSCYFCKWRLFVGSSGQLRCPKCITIDMEVCKTVTVVCRNWMPAVCKLVSFATVILDAEHCLAFCYLWLWGRQDWLIKGLGVCRRRRGEYGLSCLSDDDLSSLTVDVEGASLTVDAEGQLNRSCTNVLYLGTGAVVAVLRDVRIDN